MTERNSRALPAAVTCAGTVEREAVSRYAGGCLRTPAPLLCALPLWAINDCAASRTGARRTRMEKQVADIAGGVTRNYGRSAPRTQVLAFLVALLLPAIGTFASPAPAAAAHARSAKPAGWSAGPVQRWTGYTRGDSQRVREVQRTLRRLRYRPGSVDGLFGPRTERAVLRFQRAEALRLDGVVGPRTLRRLHVRLQARRTTRTGAPKGGARSQPHVRVAPTLRPAPPQPVSRWAPAPGAVAAVVLILVLLLLAGALTRRWRSGTADGVVALEPAAASSPRTSGRPRHEPPIRDVGRGRLFTAELQPPDPTPAALGEAVIAPPRTQAQGLRISLPRRLQGIAWLRWRDAVAQLAPGRSRTRNRVVPLSAAVFAEGVSDDPQVGDFAGFIFAVALPAPGRRGGDARDETRRYRVHDASRNAVLWVKEDEIVRTFGTRPALDASSASPSRGNATASSGSSRSRAPFARHPSSRRRSDAR
jgi:hypothetical protein